MTTTRRADLSAAGLFGIAIVFCSCVACAAAEVPWKIDKKMAQILAAEAVRHGLSADDFDYQGGMSPPFFVFDVLSRPPAEGSFGFFAVNPWTGDVWALWGCHKLTTPAVRKSQVEIRSRFAHEEFQQYARLRRLKPECIVELPEKRR